MRDAPCWRTYRRPWTRRRYQLPVGHAERPLPGCPTPGSPTHAQADGELLGPLGEEDLRLALAPLGDAAPALPVVTSGDLAWLRRHLEALDRHPATADQHLADALRTVDRLTAVRTREFLLSSWPGSLPELVIRRAYVTAAGRPASASDWTHWPR